MLSKLSKDTNEASSYVQPEAMFTIYMQLSLFLQYKFTIYMQLIDYG